MSDDFLFMEEDEQEEEESSQGTWKVLIVDDEPEIHSVTKLALSDFVFQDKTLEFVSAHSGQEAKQIFLEQRDIAVVLLDVVMETDDAGLSVAEFIREEADNHFTRIILRTGQPGQAPEKDVIINYDINDYKSKTELTAQKLFNVVIAALRSYRDIVVIEENRCGLEKIITASTNLFSLRSLESFIDGIVQQLVSILGGSENAAYLTSSINHDSMNSIGNSADLFVFSGKGEYHNKEGKRLNEVISGDALNACLKAVEQKTVVYEGEHIAAYCQSRSCAGSLLYMSGVPESLTKHDRNLVEIFSQNVQIAFENVILNRELEESQVEVLSRLNSAVKNLPKNDGHIERIALFSEVLGREIGLNESDLKKLRMSVPLYNVGQYGVGTGSSGYALLQDSKREVIKCGAIIAKEIDENWDGTGKPEGLAAESINVFTRIAAVAIALDKECTAQDATIDLKEAYQTLDQSSGSRLDPSLVSIVAKNLPELTTIVERHPV